MTDKETLIIGDVHGHFNRLEALLTQEGIIGRCEDCSGLGDNETNTGFCTACNGDGVRRINYDVFVLQLGDLGHFGPESLERDRLCYQKADEWDLDILWGNHDRAVIDDRHLFNGYFQPEPETIQVMRKLSREKRIKLAFSAHGHLVTHAGLHAQFKHTPSETSVDKYDALATAEYINNIDWMNPKMSETFALRDAISPFRGGASQVGGILWRDWKENLWNGFPQIFGHSASSQHIVRSVEAGDITHYDIDVGGRDGRMGDECLAGIYLPSKKIVRVDLDG